MCATGNLGLLNGTDATATLGGQRGSGVGAKPEAAAKHSEMPSSIRTAEGVTVGRRDLALKITKEQSELAQGC